MAKKESVFQAELIKELEQKFPGCVVMKNDSSYIQGIPDLLVLHNNKWAALEVKRSSTAKTQPNQTYYVEKLDRMSFARFIEPTNREEVLDELQQAFGSNGNTCISERK